MRFIALFILTLILGLSSAGAQTKNALVVTPVGSLDATLPDNIVTFIVDPTAPLTSETLTLPAKFKFNVLITIVNMQPVANFALVLPPGQASKCTVPSALVAQTIVRCIYYVSTKTWYPD